MSTCESTQFVFHQLIFALQVAITVFWLARQVEGVYAGPGLDFTNFTALVNAKSLSSTLGSTGPFHHHQYSSSGDWTEPDSVNYRHSRTRYGCVIFYR